ncbi:MAG: cell division protein FtsQ [Alphaproteobacteria bacterium]|nr:cell division protein FtsQ [Alphaproteobacteria bacterium]
MDGRRRLAQPLTWIARLRARPPTALRPGGGVRRVRHDITLPATRFGRVLQRLWVPIINLRVPRGVGLAATALVMLASAGYGVIKGDHIPTLVGAFKDARDQAANAAGFRIVSLALSGHQHVTREEVLATAGVTGHTSLLFLDVEAAREKLKTNPWIADASVLKLLPGELQIVIKERQAFALWQKDGRVSVIADDGTVLEPYVAPRLTRLPLVVGRGAETRVKEFLALLERYPEIRDQVRASILVGERRWNLRLKNGLDVRLPEAEVTRALERLVALDREAKLISRDIVAIDLRLADRVTVRLSAAAAQARADALKEKKPPAKKGDKA